MLSFGMLLRGLECKTPVLMQSASIMQLKIPKNYDHVRMPEKRRLKILEKNPQPMNNHTAFPYMLRNLQLIKGQEKLHNKIVYGEYAVQAVEGGWIAHGHVEAARMQVLRKMDQTKAFAYFRIDSLWLPITKRPKGVKLGGGKPSISHYVYPVRAGRILFEVGGRVEDEEVIPYMKRVAQQMPMKCRFVSRTMLAQEAEPKENLNPFTYKDCAKSNSLGISKWLSPYSYMPLRQ